MKSEVGRDARLLRVGVHEVLAEHAAEDRVVAQVESARLLTRDRLQQGALAQQVRWKCREVGVAVHPSGRGACRTAEGHSVVPARAQQAAEARSPTLILCSIDGVPDCIGVPDERAEGLLGDG